MSGQNQYFRRGKTITTRIKHAIFLETLKASLGTANNIMKRQKTSGKKVYTYVDLYAGEGLFRVGEQKEYGEEDFGTPLYAVEVFRSFLQNWGGRGHGIAFDELKILACEKDENRRYTLKAVLNPLVDDLKQRFSYPINAYVMEEWEDPINSLFIRENVCNAQFGFIFADPFNTELNLKDFEYLLRGCAVMHDVLIFVNFGHIRRALGRRQGTDVARVAHFLGLSEERLLEVISEESHDRFSYFDLVMETIYKKMFILKGRRDIFITGVCLPIDIRTRLVNQDYFGLVLATGVISVVEAFLKSYVNVVKQFSRLPASRKLFEILPEAIIDIVNRKQRLSLYSLIRSLWNGLFSWKRIVNSGLADDIPTVRKIINALNKLYNDGVIDIRAKGIKERQYLCSKVGEKGINLKFLRRVSDFRNIEILYKG